MKFIFSIFRYAWRSVTWLRNFFVNILFLVVLLVILGSISSKEQLEPKVISGALHLMPSGYLVDQISRNSSPLDLLAEERGMPVETSSLDLIKVIQEAAKDENITGLALQLDYLYGGSLSKLEEVGAALEKFKESGKPVIAYSGNYTQQQYYLASFADTVYINELGNVFITGFGSYRNYYKDAADKLAIQFHVFRVGEYKDAIEPYIRNDMSESSKDHNSQWINSLWKRYTNKIESMRQVETGTIEKFISEMPETLQLRKLSGAEYSLERGLVDTIVTPSELKSELVEHFGESHNGRSYLSVNYKHYLKKINTKKHTSNNTIGLIAISGAILDGYQTDNAIGSANFNDLMNIAQEDTELDALVIRVDSPGGSAFASEIMRQKIMETREKGLPVYISMGGVAASGGYWLAAAGEEIWASPSTITGSIGVFGLMPNFTNSLEKVGIYSDGVGTTPLSDAFRPDRHMSTEAKSVFQSGVNNIYTKFLAIVSQARNKTPEQIHAIAQGRVWTGEKALEIGLVDNLGSLEDLFESIAEKSEFKNYSVKTIRRQLSTSEQFMQALMDEADVKTKAFVAKSISLEAKLGFGLQQSLSSRTRELEPILHQLSNPNTLHVFAQCIGCEAR